VLVCCDSTRCALLLIDVEPDARKTLPGSEDGWGGTRAALPLIADLRRRLAERTGAEVQLNWFLRMDPQIEMTWGRADWVRQAVPELLAMIAERGDYTGIHPHLWRWDATARTWYNDFEDAAWMRHCLDTATRAHEDVFGRRPEACRFGDHWSSAAAMHELRARGIRYDLSVEPGLRATLPPGDRGARGTLPDYRAAPRVPYRPACDDYLEPSAAGDLWIVPLTTSPTRWVPTLQPPFVSWESVSPNLVLNPLLVRPLLARELARATAAPLVLVLRSGDLGHWRFRAQFRGNVARLLAHPDLARFEFTTPPVAIRRWLARRDR
jgi:hypothetical protein